MPRLSFLLICSYDYNNNNNYLVTLTYLLKRSINNLFKIDFGWLVGRTQGFLVCNTPGSFELFAWGCWCCCCRLSSAVF